MNILVINTAGEHVEIAVKVNNKTAFYTNQKKEMASIVLLSEIEKLLSDNDASLADIDYFGGVIGPGSFTGIRIGIATIRAFCQALNKRAVAVNRLELIAYNNRNRFFDLQKTSSSDSPFDENASDQNLKAVNCQLTGTTKYNQDERDNQVERVNLVSVVDGQNGVSYVGAYSYDLASQLIEPVPCKNHDLKQFLSTIEGKYDVLSDGEYQIDDLSISVVPCSCERLLEFVEYKLRLGLDVSYTELEPLYIRRPQAERAAGEL